MKEKITGAERISDALVGIEEELLAEAAYVDSDQKMKMTRRRERLACHPLGKAIAVAASLLLMSGIISAAPHLNNASHTTANSGATVSSESSTVRPSRGEINPEGLVISFDSMEELGDFLAAAKSEEYSDYCEEGGVKSPPSAEEAEKIADSILTSDYHIGLKIDALIDGFTALYTDDGEGVLRFSFETGRAKYVVSHFYGVTSVADCGESSVVRTLMLGDKTVSMLKTEDHFFADMVLGNTCIHIAIFADHIDEDSLSMLEIVHTSEAFLE